MPVFYLFLVKKCDNKMINNFSCLSARKEKCSLETRKCELIYLFDHFFVLYKILNNCYSHVFRPCFAVFWRPDHFVSVVDSSKQYALFSIMDFFDAKKIKRKFFKFCWKYRRDAAKKMRYEEKKSSSNKMVSVEVRDSSEK